MRINPITMVSNNVYRVNFKARNDDDEYVYVPLIWDKENYDSVDFSNKPDESQSKTQPASTNNSPKQDSKFKKFATRTAGTIGTVTLLPGGVEKVAKDFETSAVATKDSINNTIDAIADVKEHAKVLKNKDKTEKSEQQTKDETASEPGIAGETPVADHSDFDRRFQKDDEPEDEFNDYDYDDDPDLEDVDLGG